MQVRPIQMRKVRADRIRYREQYHQKINKDNPLDSSLQHLPRMLDLVLEIRQEVT